MLQHTHHHVPVTALAFSKEDLIFAGEGHFVSAYNAKTLLRLACSKVFEQQAVHGLITCETASSQLVAWGGTLVRSIQWSLTADGRLLLRMGKLFKATDWILDTSFSQDTGNGNGKLLALVTAHNALIILDANRLFAGETPDLLQYLEPQVPGSNCLLYCAHIVWLSPSRCLIASGTAFGDVIVWSATLSYTEYGTLVASTQTHHTFPAHEGSVFGIQLSPDLVAGELGECQRALTTCSDDRTIRMWDVSDLPDNAVVTLGAQRSTGYSTNEANNEGTPKCLAKAMGHISRIWQVHYTPNQGQEPHTLQITSFGEDATSISWRTRPLEDDSAFALQQYQVASGHSGKHIWSVALANDGRVATGGADGGVAIHVLEDEPLKGSEIVTPLTEQPGSVDTFKSYGFIGPDLLMATTTLGKIVVLELDGSSSPRVREVAGTMVGLRGYSVVATACGIGWVAGLDGNVYMYVHEYGSLQQVLDDQRKTAGLFAHESQDFRNRANLLITSVGGVTATLLQFELDTGANNTGTPRVMKHTSLALPDGFVVTSFTSALAGNHGYAVLGSRSGSVAMYSVARETDAKSTLPICLLSNTHGKEAVTAVVLRGMNDHGSWLLLHSTGRDGKHAVHKLGNVDEQWSIELIHCLALPYGPNIEGLTFRADGHIWTWGFKGKHFIAYDITAQREVMTAECGGAHRQCAFQPSEGGGLFVWTGKAKLYQQRQTELLYSLSNLGGHGREIKCMAVSPSESRILATGAEDTNIKLWAFDQLLPGFRCIQTLRKHNTGIQHLQWSDDSQFLLSSGGFEEFYIWRITPSESDMKLGVVCESMHPSSGTSDLRIMSFESRRERCSPDDTTFVIHMVYSDSTIKRWQYTSSGNNWSLLAQGGYLTSCLTRVFTIHDALMTTATDGHITAWHNEAEDLGWTHRHKVHQSSILSMISHTLTDGSTLVITGGDDNGIGLTRVTVAGNMKTLLLPRAHAAAVTGLAVTSTSQDSLTFASGSLDQRLKLWQADVNVSLSGVDGVDFKRLASEYTAVADVSSLASYTMDDGAVRVLVGGVGVDFWRVSSGEVTTCEEI
ncbi:WD repeat-containing protein 6 [Elasticomyces elasticus]|nr:WD repeat-containing protein 6 [Elasticomyces elasticus]KAK3638843.1 WD repeat-containing protein 6 [Elasticomyces elasticus]KAK4913121.1 WD repeat-containing protein 6 [Elasticomyces elasticus]KAK5752337.1 WD repeat-containing protein 6 [Elasticomyces elasticus]